MTNAARSKRSIRSFVLRQGRKTESQRKAYEQLWPKYGVDFSGQLIDFKELFGNEAAVVLEIGFGMGDSLAAMAKANPEQNYLGIEVHTPGVGCLLATLEREQITNLKIIQHDAVEVLEQSIADNSLARVQIFFPDPWHKKKHHKRRLIQAPLVNTLLKKLATKGTIHCATDWEDYALHMMEVLSANQHLENTSGEGQYTARPTYRPETKFERRGINLGHDVWDLIFFVA